MNNAVKFKLLLIFLTFAIILYIAWNYRTTPFQGTSNSQLLDKNSLLCKQCNLLLLNIELLRADYVGLLNSEKNTNTPNIDRFFSNSIQFNNVSAPAGETYRSNLSILTSKEAFNYPATEKQIHRFIQNYKKNKSDEELVEIEKMLLKHPSLVEKFNAAGYHTISLNQGIRAGKKLLLDRGFDKVVNWNRRKVSYRQTIDALLDKLYNISSFPYFMLYRPEVLHPLPYFYPQDYDRIEDPKRIINRYRPQYSRFNIRANHANSTAEIRRTLHDIYAQQVRLVDNELNLIFKHLEKSGLLPKTIVVLYANHGSGLGDNGVEKLAVSYQSSIHVPLIIRHPAVEQSIQINTPVTMLDLMPTLLQLTGNKIPVKIAGRSLIRDYSQAKDVPRPIIGRNDFDEYIRLGEYKLIRKQGNRLELYYLDVDPGENNNIATDEPARKRKMASMLDSIKLNILKNQPH